MLDCKRAPMMMGFVPGLLNEEGFRHAMLVSGGYAAVLVERPMILALHAADSGCQSVMAAPGVRRARSSVPVER